MSASCAFRHLYADRSTSAWLPNTELTKLDPEECKDFSERGKTKSLIQAYHVAAEGHDIEHFKTMLLDHQKALQEDQEQREAREAAKAEKAERAGKKKRKSEVAEEDEDIDMEDAEEEGKSEPKKSSKKRKKDVESDGEDGKVCSGMQRSLTRVLTYLANSLRRLPNLL
jgi:dihydroorotase-like cyclic amidohydrolase